MFETMTTTAKSAVLISNTMLNYVPETRRHLTTLSSKLILPVLVATESRIKQEQHQGAWDSLTAFP